MNKRKVILLSIVVVLLAIIFVLFVFKYKKIEIEGDYTGYQLILTVKYGGSGIAGQDLGSGTEKKIFNISENDIFYEPMFGGMWLLNADIEYEQIGNISISNYSTILEIMELEENTVTVKNKDKTYNIKYNEELDISSNTTVFDGINYKYTIKVIQKR